MNDRMGSEAEFFFSDHGAIITTRGGERKGKVGVHRVLTSMVEEQLHQSRRTLAQRPTQFGFLQELGVAPVKSRRRPFRSAQSRTAIACPRHTLLLRPH